MPQMAFTFDSALVYVIFFYFARGKIERAFVNENIAIIKEQKKLFFKANDVAKILDISNIRVSIQNFDDDEKVIRNAYDVRGCLQDTLFLTSHGIYRLLYSSKKKNAKEFHV